MSHKDSVKELWHGQVPQLENLEELSCATKFSRKSCLIQAIHHKRWNQYILLTHYMQSEVSQAFLCCNFPDYDLQLIKTSNPKTHKMLILWIASVLGWKCHTLIG